MTTELKDTSVAFSTGTSPSRHTADELRLLPARCDQFLLGKAEAEELAQSYLTRKQTQREQQREELQRRLARLKVQQAGVLPDDVGDVLDDEHRQLLLKYGDRLYKRSPRHLRRRHGHWGEDAEAGQAHGRMRRPPVPSVRRSLRPGDGGHNGAASEFLPSLRGGGVPMTAQDGHDPVGAVSRASGPLSAATIHQFQCAVGSSAVAGGGASHTAGRPAAGGVVGVGEAQQTEVVGAGAAQAGAGGQHHSPKPAGVRIGYQSPNESLMPRKDMLRKKQQQILRNSNVVYFRQHLTDQFKKIVETVELPFPDTTRRRQQVLVPPVVATGA